MKYSIEHNYIGECLRGILNSVTYNVAESIQCVPIRKSTWMVPRISLEVTGYWCASWKAICFIQLVDTKDADKVW